MIFSESELAVMEAEEVSKAGELPSDDVAASEIPLPQPGEKSDNGEGQSTTVDGEVITDGEQKTAEGDSEVEGEQKLAEEGEESKSAEVVDIVPDEVKPLDDAEVKARSEEFHGTLEKLASRVEAEYQPQFEQLASRKASVRAAAEEFMRSVTEVDEDTKTTRQRPLTADETLRLSEIKDAANSIIAEENALKAQRQQRFVDGQINAWVDANAKDPVFTPYKAQLEKLARTGQIVNDRAKMLALCKIEHAREHGTASVPTRQQVQDKALEKSIAKRSLGKIGAGKSTSSSASQKPKSVLDTASPLERAQLATLKSYLSGERVD